MFNILPMPDRSLSKPAFGGFPQLSPYVGIPRMPAPPIKRPPRGAPGISPYIGIPRQSLSVKPSFPMPSYPQFFQPIFGIQPMPSFGSRPRRFHRPFSPSIY